ncbi:phospho-N-acetylmuramoyl-pentapeptide-transferase [Haliovirga abyssi]|uniref:Phospho-N-acetylmuramoyl-pentapeptide-transferase n=1 Tax=Haliovirga abyssi TaxID=2996794 RepID=A0AAU9D0U9_9FUSO|nr:phospho-N-acetylmuramoyl-pentapeptide-transferase [Haliovirga abyssi]BDU49594.1 phospho-N-acetylmuramoyl-pentapeptide-transferase [Haliovirga abyssi]
MLYYIYQYLYHDLSVFRIFRYITLRAMIAFVTSFLFVLIIGKPFIKFIKNKKVGEDIRELGPATHFSKKGTPTMGGVLILSSIIFTTLITGNLENKFIILLLLITILFGVIGFLDDFLKWSEKNKKGLSPKKKILGQVIISILVFVFIIKYKLIGNNIDFSLVNPLIKNSYLELGAFFYFIFLLFFITGTSNAVNITDGLDGLVIGPVMITSSILGIVAYFTGHLELSKYLNLYYIEGSGEILVYILAIVGSGLGFLWYNFYPAEIFMGDTGSLTLGGIIAVISILLKQELLLLVIGFVFVIETLSVIIQVGSYKTRKKRVFRMAPIHHHFELKGLPETKVTIRFWIISIICGLIGLLILKLR